MDLGSVAILLGGGVVAGFLAGVFGVGGGIVLVPFLIWFLQANGVSSLVSTHIAFGTSLCVAACASAASAAVYQRHGQVVWRAVLAIGLASIAGALAGSTIAGVLEGTTLRKCFAAVVAVAALRLMTRGKKGKRGEDPNLALPGLAGAGVIVGLVSALAGVGGGVISIPIMNTFLKFPVKQALGTSSATIVITALAASAGYMVRGWDNQFLPGGTLGFVDPLRALPIIAGAIPAALAGARVANGSRHETLTRAFAIFLLIIALKMFFF